MAPVKKISPAPKSEPVEAITPPADAVPANVTFIGEGAEKIKFTVDPKAKKTVVYADGIVVSSY